MNMRHEATKLVGWATALSSPDNSRELLGTKSMCPTYELAKTL